jgi:hypothetical protein
MQTTYPNQKPGLFTAIAVLTLTSGIVNLFWGFVASATALGTIVGVICLPITILPTILGIFEIIYAAKLLGTQPQPIQPSQSIAAFEIASILVGNIFSMVVGILALVFYNDLAVRNYFVQLNGTMPSAPMATPPAPAALPEPVIEEPAAPELPQTEETPEKPRRIRKVAGK